MSFLTCDFETYYGDGLGFKTQTNEEYLRDPRFHVIGVSVKKDDEPAIWFSGSHEEIKNFLMQFDWENSAVLAHNTMFDGAILAWHFGIIPAFYYDTLCMARAIHGVEAGGSLKALTEYYGIGRKGDEVVNAYNLTRSDFTPEHLARYGEYCKNDVELTYKLFQILSEARPITDNPAQIMEQYKYLNYCNRPREFPEDEYKLIDMTLRMYIEPTLCVDDALLNSRLVTIRDDKQLLLSGLMGLLQVGTEEEVRKKLSSNPQFAKILQDLGVEVPMKISPTTGKETFALAKNDEGFIALMDHPEPVVQELVSVRLGTKSTQEEGRIVRFINIGGRNKGKLPVPLKYYGAHTGRWGGDDKINMQNLPSRDKSKKTLKNSVIAPPGHFILNCDSSQIEARILAWLAGQQDVVQAFRNKRDIYCEDASKIYGFQVTKANATERFVGKTCLSASSQVLTRRGWVPIVEVQGTDKLWDGEEWVTHCGVSYMGQKPTIRLYGLELTPDHEILTGHTKWETALSALTHDTVFQSALSTATLPSLDMLNMSPQIPASHGGGNRYVDAGAAVANTAMQDTIYAQEDPPHAINALDEKRLINAGGNTVQPCQMISTAAGCLTDYLRLLGDAITLKTETTEITEREVFLCTADGEKTTQYFYGTYKPLMDGIAPNTRWTVSTMIRDMYRAIYSLSQPRKIHRTNEPSKNLRPVFDILNCGLRNRFTVLTNRGPIIVHNCRLGLGFGTGADKLRHTLKVSPPGADIQLDQARGFVQAWRDANPRIVEFWGECERNLPRLVAWPEGVRAHWLGAIPGVVEVTPEGFRLPNGLYIRYHNLRRELDVNRQFMAWYYDSRKGKQKLWGGTITENIVQALARIVIGEQMIKINERYKVVLTVHDAAVVVVPEAEIEPALTYIMDVMSTPPLWGDTLPVACEATWGPSYGETIGKRAS